MHIVITTGPFKYLRIILQLIFRFHLLTTSVTPAYAFPVAIKVFVWCLCGMMMFCLVFGSVSCGHPHLISIVLSVCRNKVADDAFHGHRSIPTNWGKSSRGHGVGGVKGHIWRERGHLRSCKLWLKQEGLSAHSRLTFPSACQLVIQSLGSGVAAALLDCFHMLGCFSHVQLFFLSSHVRPSLPPLFTHQWLQNKDLQWTV